MTDEQLEQLYKSAMGESHIAGLRAVWIAAQPVVEVVEPEPVVDPTPKKAKK